MALHAGQDLVAQVALDKYKPKPYKYISIQPPLEAIWQIPLTAIILTTIYFTDNGVHMNSPEDDWKTTAEEPDLASHRTLTW